MSQRKALIASIVITLLLAFSAIGIRAWMNNPSEAASLANDAAPLTVLTLAGNALDDQAYQGDDDDDAYEGQWSSDDDDDDHDDDYSREDDDHEDDDDDD